MVSYNFNNQGIAPYVGYEPIPEGWYKVIITNSELKPTKEQNGGYLEFDLTVQEGQYQGRVVKWRLNIHNQNPQTVEIANRQLSALTHVVGVYSFSDTMQLHNIPFNAHVVVTENKEQGGKSNNVRGLKDVNGNDPGKAGSGPQASQPAPNSWQQGQPQQQPGWQGQPNQQPQQPQGGWQQPQQAPQQPGWQGQPQQAAQQPGWQGQPQQPQQAPQNGSGPAPWNNGQAPQQQAPQQAGGWQGGAPQQAAPGNGGAPWGQR